jgi:hypothetical protein
MPTMRVNSIAGMFTAGLIALLGLLFPFGPSESNWKLAAPPSSLSVFEVVPNRAAKGDRLSSMQTTIHDSIPSRVEFRPAQMNRDKIPEGCDPAFSRIVKSGNFAARCVTVVDVSTKFA